MRYLICEVQGTYGTSDGAVVNEIRINNGAVPFTTTASDVYDSFVGGIPPYWNDSIWGRNKLVDGNTAYGGDSSCIMNYYYGNSSITKWTRFLMDLGSDVAVTKISTWAGGGGAKNRVPCNVKFYSVDSVYDKASHLNGRSNVGLTLYGTATFASGDNSAVKQIDVSKAYWKVMPEKVKTNIREMNIGDVISCEYSASSGVLGSFANLGSATKAEIPVGGSASPDGKFYFIHVGYDHQGKAKLVADRYIQTSISWNTLNNAGISFGVPFKLQTVPKMASNTVPEGVASTSAVEPVASTYYAYMAFDRVLNTANKWLAPVGNNWLAYEYPNAVCINAYSVVATLDYLTRMAKNWTFEGSNDDINWTVLDTRVNQIDWAAGQKRYFSFVNAINYKKYRINVTANNGDNTYISIGELELHADTPNQPIMRLLSGGNGTDTDNEWDAIIVNSDLDGLIAPGDNIVWNWAGMWSWTSSTNNVGQEYRTVRGYSSVADKSYSAPNASYSFRPILIVDVFTNTPVISGINLSNTTIWSEDTDNVTIQFEVTTETPTQVQYKVEVNGQSQDYSELIDTPTGTLTAIVSKNQFNQESNSLVISVKGEADVATWGYSIKKEDVDTLTFVRLFEFPLEWSVNTDVSIIKGVGLSVPGAAAKQSITTLNSPIHTDQKATITSVTVQGSNLDDTESSIVRFLVSKDGRNTWYAFDGSTFNQVNLTDIYTSGMSKSVLEGISQSQWRDWFSKGTLDFAVGIFSDTGVTSTAIVRSITVTFPADEAPLIQNPSLSPDTIHNEFVFLTATLNDLEGEQVKYKIAINGTQVYPSEGWSALYDSGKSISHGYNAPYFNIGDNTVTLTVADEGDRERTWEGIVVLAETAPTITVTHTDFVLNGSIGDAESDQVAYRILINGIQKYPPVNEWSDFADSPRAISFEWDNADVIFGQSNTVRVESKDSFGMESNIEFSFTGTYKGIMFTDDAGNYYSDYAGVLLKYLDMGTLIAGRMTDPAKVHVKNKNGFPVENIRLSRDNSVLPAGVEMQLSKQQLPFVSEDSLIYTQVLADSEEVSFYTRIVADEDAHGSGEFDILVNADPVD